MKDGMVSGIHRRLEYKFRRWIMITCYLFLKN